MFLFFAFLVFLQPDHRHSLFAHYGTFLKMSIFKLVAGHELSNFVGQLKEKWCFLFLFSPQKSTPCDHIQLRSVPADFFIHQ